MNITYFTTVHLHNCSTYFRKPGVNWT